ncbi:MAG TPA: DUF2461 domain-containing protein [Novimethylophilus sp.]|jgi:uncharacterized protein (TIGR02453 family)|uniref:DUF2461 domain-containing protein n=1 Tax=Novimethylophilus sp. TaxID=2137426 RepID=UPI002F408097
MNGSGFDGFPPACFEFLATLEQHNNREWFISMRETCETQAYLPAQSFTSSLGLALKKTHPEIVFDPRTNGMGSMFRLARDTRFSRDKSPYKTNLGFRFWLSEEARRAKRVGLYVHLDKSGVRVYGGAHQLTPEELATFRDHVAQDRHAAALRRILAELENMGYELEAERLARIPRGYAADHANADLLVYKSLFAISPKVAPDIARKPELVNECAAHAAALKPLNDWFAEALPLPSSAAV